MRHLLVILAILITVIGLAFWYFQAHVHPVLPLEVIVDNIEGAGHVTNSDGKWLKLKAGDKIIEGKRVYTEKNAQIKLVVDNEDQLTLYENTNVLIQDISDAGVSFELKQGQIEANVKRFRDKYIHLGVEGNNTSVETRDGHLKIVSDGWGTMDVAAMSGKIDLISNDKREQIKVGEHEVVADDGTKLLKGPIPSSVLLKVEWPEAPLLKKKELEVKGHVTPGSRVFVEEKLVRPDKSGNFKHDIMLKEGMNQVNVMADGMGKPAKELSPQIQVDTSPPKVQTRTDGIWK